MFDGKQYREGGPWLHAIGLKVAAAYAQKDPDRIGKTVVSTITTMLRVAPGGPQFGNMYWDAQPYLALQNGTLDLSNPSQPTFLDGHWDPKHRITWSIGADWDPSVQCPVVDQFLASSIPDPDRREMLLEYLGLALARWDVSLQSYLFQLGQGSNGKGLIQSVIMALVGEAASSVSLADLTSNRFSAAGLADKAVNLVGDESSGILKDASKIKQYTGGDAIAAEAKFRMAYSLIPKVKLIFSLNQLQRITDFSNGFFRRPLIVEFPPIFPKNRQLEADLTAPDALSYWLKLFVEAYGRLKARGDFARTHTRNSLQCWREQNDIVTASVAEGFLQIDAGGSVPQDALVAGMKIFGELLGMKSPRLAETIERLNSLAAWQAQATGAQPAIVKAAKPHGEPRKVEGINWGTEIFDTKYRPSPRDEYQTIAEWLGVPGLLDTKF